MEEKHVCVARVCPYCGKGVVCEVWATATEIAVGLKQMESYVDEIAREGGQYVKEGCTYPNMKTLFTDIGFDEVIANKILVEIMIQRGLRIGEGGVLIGGDDYDGEIHESIRISPSEHR